MLVGGNNDVRAFCAEVRLKSKTMPESLRKKKERLYDHLNAAMENPTDHPQLHSVILQNAKRACLTPNDWYEVHLRLEYLEGRIASLDAKIEMIGASLVTLIRLIEG